MQNTGRPAPVSDKMTSWAIKAEVDVILRRPPSALIACLTRWWDVKPTQAPSPQRPRWTERAPCWVPAGRKQRRRACRTQSRGGCRRGAVRAVAAPTPPTRAGPPDPSRPPTSPVYQKGPRGAEAPAHRGTGLSPTAARRVPTGARMAGADTHRHTRHTHTHHTHNTNTHSPHTHTCTHRPCTHIHSTHTHSTRHKDTHTTQTHTHDTHTETHHTHATHTPHTRHAHTLYTQHSCRKYTHVTHTVHT